MDKLRTVGIQILDEFEDLLDFKGIKIPSADRGSGDQSVTEACLYGSEYYELEDSVVEILGDNFRNAANDEEGFFPITSVHRGDVKEALRLTDKQVAKITDDMMREIARKMADDYGEQLFWDQLPIIVEAVAEREGIDLFRKGEDSKRKGRRNQTGGGANGKV